MAAAVAHLREALTAFHLSTGGLGYRPAALQATGSLDAMLHGLAEWWAVAADAPDAWPTAPIEVAMEFGMVRAALIGFVLESQLADAVRCECHVIGCANHELTTAEPPFLVRRIAQVWHALSRCGLHAPRPAQRHAAAPVLAANRQALRGLAYYVTTCSGDAYAALGAAADRATASVWGREAAGLLAHGFAAWYGGGIVREPAIEAVRIARDLRPAELTPAEHSAARRAIELATHATAMAGLADARIVEGALAVDDPAFTYAALLAAGARNEPPGGAPGSSGSPPPDARGPGAGGDGGTPPLRLR